MGRTSSRKGDVERQGQLFSEAAASVAPSVTSRLPTAQNSNYVIGKPPEQSNAKSLLISEYIERFQLVTKGGLYIDGFAAPQSRDHEEAWTARRVLRIKPARLRRFWLCELEPRGLEQLRELKAEHDRTPRFRHVHVMEGDFNETVKTILKSGRILRKSACFALLDQRTAECHWATVEALAAHKGRTKIELLYFLGTSWLHRSLAASTTENRLYELDLWWGSRGWKDLLELTQIEIAKRVADRFQKELGYKHVAFHPIYQGPQDKKAIFHLIHATDHSEAPKLMARAYQEVVGSVPGTVTDRQHVMQF